MPKITFKKRIFVLRWDAKQDAQLLAIACLFREGCYNCSKKPQINWKKAESQKFLKNFPKNLTYQDLSHRVSYLLRIGYNPKGTERRKIYQKIHSVHSVPNKLSNKTFNDKNKIFKHNLNIESKKTFGYKSKNKWDSKQQQILLELVKKHPKGKMSIDWKSLMQDKLIKTIPSGYTLPRLRSFYWTLLKRSNDEVIKKRRKSALEYKKKNYKKYKN